MGKMKIHEIAKETGISNKDIIQKANELGISVSSHMSAIEDDEAQKIINSFKGVKNQKANSEPNKEKGDKKTKKESTPVIIRREVIINDDQNNRDDKKNNNRKDVGFVERDRNKDYNIVYRKQPVKPLTASELFGLKPKKQEEKEPQKVESKTEKIEETKQKNIKEMEQEVKKEMVEETQINKEKIETEEKQIQNNYHKENNFNKQNTDNRVHNFKNGDNRFNNRQNNDNRYNKNNENRYDNRFNNRTNNTENRFSYRQNGENKFNRYDNQENGNRFNNRQNNDNRFQNRNGQVQKNNFNKTGRPLDEKGIDKNIKDIMSVEIVEKESQRDYSSRVIDKEKQNKFEENKANKKPTKNKKSNRFENYDGEKLKNLKQVDKLSHMFNEQDGGMLDYYDLTTERGKRNKKKIKNDEERNKQKIFELTEICIPETITVKDLAAELKKTSAEVIKKLFGYGIMATLNNEVDFDTAFLVAEEFGVKATKKEVVNEEDVLFDESEDSDDELISRPPVVVVMGHVDHGKTSLLDAIRSTNVIEGEAGGITQHIGAYMVNINGRDITFLDTPGHEAFTSMRARGAQITDVAILVVAADDGVMPQTVEAINHAKAANIPIIVAVNKIDLPNANVDKIKQELMQYELVAEEWGGDTIFVPISAKNKINIDNLLEMVLLVSDMQELKVNPNKQAKGAVIEARLDKARGPIASVLIQRGRLDVGDTIVVGTSIGRIRAMKNDRGQSVKQAGPSTPVEVMGLTDVPEAGDTFYEVKNEKMAKHLIEKRKTQEREKAINNSNVVTLDNLFEKMETGDLKQLNLIVKSDVQGSAEAVKQSLEKLSNDEVKVKVIHAIAGAITETDVQLAKAANAIIIGFNVRPELAAEQQAKKEKVDMRLYSVIYDAINDVETALKGMMPKKYKEVKYGTAEVRKIFKITGVGIVAGCYVKSGKIVRGAMVRLVRDNIVLLEIKIDSLKREKDDVKEVNENYECGIKLENYSDIKEGDIFECFTMEEVK